jgi:hypothetical protein
MIDNIIRENIFPKPNSKEYTIYFKDVENEQQGVETNTNKLLIMDVLEGANKPYVITGSSGIRCYERLNASNIPLHNFPNELRQRIVKVSENLGEKDNFKSALLFPEGKIQVEHSVLTNIQEHIKPKTLNFGKYFKMNESGEFEIDRPLGMFKLLYNFLQIGVVTIKKIDLAIFLNEVTFYGYDFEKICENHYSNGEFITFYHKDKSEEIEKIKKFSEKLLL